MDELDIAKITKRSIQSVFALISRQFILQLVSIGASLVVYTQLSPRENGIYAFVMSMQRVISFFTDFGLGAALVHKKENIHQNDVKTTFTVQVVITFIIFMSVFLFRDMIATYFNLEQSGMWLLIVLVFTIFLSSFKMIPSVVLERNINFKKLIIPQIIEQLTFNIILVVLLIKGFGIVSYSWAFIVAGLIGIPIYYIISPWKIALGYNKDSFAHLKYGIQFQAKNVLATIKDDLLVIMLRFFMPFEHIGLIRFGTQWAFFPFRFIVDSVTKVTFSTFSRIREDTYHLQKAVEKTLFFVSSAMFPLLAGLIITAPYIISFIPKWQKWEPAIFSLVFFSLNAGVSSISSILVNILDATGRVKTTLKLMIIWTILIWTITPILVVTMGYNGVSVASFLVTLTIVYTIYLVKQTVPIQFLKSIQKPFLASVIMSIVVFTLTKFFVSNIVVLIFVILTGGAVYLFSMYLLSGKQLIQDFQGIRKRNE